MERPSFISRSSSSLSSLLSNDEKSLLPRPAYHQKPKIRVRTLLGHCLYRRVILWTAAGLVIIFLTLTSGNHGLRRERLLDLVKSKPYEKPEGSNGVNGVDGAKGDPGVAMVVTGSSKTEPPVWREGMPYWLRFRQ